MFINLIIFLGILVVATVVLVNIKSPSKPTLPPPIYYQNQLLNKECQVSASFAHEAKAAPLNPHEQEEVENLYTTLK